MRLPFGGTAAACAVLIAALGSAAALVGSSRASTAFRGAAPLAAAGEGKPLSAARGAAFPVRMVKLSGSPRSARVRAHVRFCIEEAGFNALWVYGGEAGQWTLADAPFGPFLHPEFLELARWCRERGVRIAVSVNPVADTRESFLFTSRKEERRIRRFFDLLRRHAGVHDFVLSFDDQPTKLTDLGDIGRYGHITAPAHLDLARRLDGSMKPGDRFWLCATAYCDRHLGQEDHPYRNAFLREIGSLPARIGIVWTGTEVISRSITGTGLAATRGRLGGRDVLLYDNYPANDSDRGVLALNLGPLRFRDPGIAGQAAVYLACPMSELGASRLPLLTTADYLADPAGYDPDSSWRRAIARLAGENEEARRALEEQALEWGAWIGERLHPGEDADPEDAAETLDDPDAAAAWAATVRTYPARIQALRRVADAALRDDLIEAMTRRLAVARGWPLARAYIEAREGGAPGALVGPADRLQALRLVLSRDPQSIAAFDRFLEAAEIPRPAIPTPLP